MNGMGSTRWKATSKLLMLADWLAGWLAIFKAFGFFVLDSSVI